jgi:hypothetical protein
MKSGDGGSGGNGRCTASRIERTAEGSAMRERVGPTTRRIQTSKNKIRIGIHGERECGTNPRALTSGCR